MLHVLKKIYCVPTNLQDGAGGLEGSNRSCKYLHKDENLEVDCT